MPRDLAPLTLKESLLRDRWMDHAACRGVVEKTGDHATFFPAREVGPFVSKARTLCVGCPVRTVCLDFAIRNNVRDGIWGGKSTAQRDTLRGRWTKTRDAFLADIDRAVGQVAYVVADGKG